MLVKLNSQIMCALRASNLKEFLRLRLGKCVGNLCYVMIEVNGRVVITRNLTRTNSTRIGDGLEIESVFASDVQVSYAVDFMIRFPQYVRQSAEDKLKIPLQL